MANVVIKIDMAKAYDSVEWDFLAAVLRRMGFDEIFIDKIWRLLANNWYSILIKGQACGFFHSTRGVKQGDPLSLSLFIIMVEVLSRASNNLFTCASFQCYELPKWSDQINHLSYDDGIIIFVKADGTTLELLMKILNDYESQSGQKINKESLLSMFIIMLHMKILKGWRSALVFTKGSSL